MANSFFGCRPPPSISSQFASASPESLVTVNGLGEVAVATWRGRRFVLESTISSKRARGRTSWIRNEGIFVRELLPPNNTTGTPLTVQLIMATHSFTSAEVYWVCRHCDRRGTLERLYNGKATSSPSDHLAAKHKIHVDSSNELSEQSIAPEDQEPPQKRLRLHVRRSDKLQAEELALGYIINSDSPFDAFNDTYMKQILQLFNPSLASATSLARTSMKTRLDKLFYVKKQAVRQELVNALTQVHLAFDLWTSPNSIAILGVSGHFLDDHGHAQQRLLALSQQQGAHTGDNIASTLAAVVRDWGIADRLGVLVSDNASNNDSCGKALFTQIDPFLGSEDICHRRIRCYGHIINLVGRAFLYGDDSESIEQESQAYEVTGNINKELALWRKKGPLGKLHNIIKWIRASPQRREYFKESIAEAVDEGDTYLLHEQSTFELQLILNNETRWNSTYLMIQRAVTKQGQIQTFLAKNQEDPDHNKRIAEEDVLTFEDWRLLVELQEILTPLYWQTLRTQGWAEKGSHGTLWEVIGGVEYLLEKMELWKTFFDEHPGTEEEPLLSPATAPKRVTRRGKQQPSPSAASLEVYRHFDEMNEQSRRYFRLSVTTGWKKLNDYYTKLGDSPLYSAAIILHPGFGLSWLEKHWTDEQVCWVREAHQSIRTYWKRWYRQDDTASTVTGWALEQRAADESEAGSEFDKWMNACHQKEPSVELEIDQYLAAKPEKVADPIAWWLSHREEYPTVSQFALDVFAIPAMAADCERAFSLAKLTLSPQRLSMSPATLEHLQCLKNWLRRGAVSLGTVLPQPSKMTSESTGHSTPPETEE